MRIQESIGVDGSPTEFANMQLTDAPLTEDPGLAFPTLSATPLANVCMDC